jgi:hypothetical protein
MYSSMTGYFIFFKCGETYLNKGDELNNNFFTFFIPNYLTNNLLQFGCGSMNQSVDYCPVHAQFTIGWKKRCFIVHFLFLL